MKVLSILLSIFITGFGLFLLLENQNKSSNQKEYKFNELGIKACDLHARACEFDTQLMGKIKLDIIPKPIKPNIPLKFILSIENDRQLIKKIDFKGIEMDMGHHRPSFEKIKTGHYQVETVLPSCTADKMTWKITLLFFDINKIHTLSTTLPITNIK